MIRRVGIAMLLPVGVVIGCVEIMLNAVNVTLLGFSRFIESPRPIAEGYDVEAANRGLRVARILSMPSVVFHQGLLAVRPAKAEPLFAAAEV